MISEVNKKEIQSSFPKNNFIIFILHNSLLDHALYMAKSKKAKKKVKRYSVSQKKEILDFISKKGRGGQTKAVAKFGVTAATIASWRLKDGGSGVKTAKGASKELRAVEELAGLIKEISTIEVRLEKLKKAYQKAKAKL